MAAPGRVPLSPMSAALTLVAWTQTHGRAPRCTECVGQEGLHWYPTYYDAFALSSWSAILDEARALTSGLGVSLVVTMTPTLKRCLNAPECPSLIPDEGPAIRLCASCHHESRRVGVFVEPLVSRQRWRRWGFHDIEGDPWEEGIDWGVDGRL